MSINKNITNTKRPVPWKGETAAELRAISAHDLAVVLVRAGNNLENLFRAWEDFQLPQVDPRNGGKIDSEQAAEIIMEKAPAIIGLIAEHLPSLLADIIAVAADSPEDATYIQENFPAPLQLDCLMVIAEETFVDPAGFREFVGKAMALVRVAKGIVSPNADKKTKTRARVSANG